MPFFYDSVVRVPLIVRGPSQYLRSRHPSNQMGLLQANWPFSWVTRR